MNDSTNEITGAVNFNVEVLKNGIHRKVLGYDLAQAAASGKV